MIVVDTFIILFYNNYILNIYGDSFNNFNNNFIQLIINKK